jgi:hypothetical protein
MVEDVTGFSKLFCGLAVVDMRELAFTYAERLKAA